MIKTVLILYFFSIGLYLKSQVNSPKNPNKTPVLEEQLARIFKTPESAAQYLSIRLFPDDLFDDSTKKDLIYQNDFDGLISVLTVNLDEAVKSVNRNEIEHWNLPDEKLFSLAKEQTKKLVKDVSFEAVDVDKGMKYYFAYDEPNYFVNSLLFFPDLLKKFDRNKKGIIIGIPARHMCTIMPLNSTKTIYEDLTQYYNFLIQVYTNEPNPTTLKMFLYKEGNLYTISALYDNEDNFVRFLAPDVLTK